MNDLGSSDSLLPFLDYLRHERGMSPRTIEAYSRDVQVFLQTAQDLGVLSAPADRPQWPNLAGQRGLIRAHLAQLR